jgi:hypothetical protein
MSLPDYFGKNFFEPHDRLGKPVLGQMGWAPTPNLQPQPFVIEAERIEPASHTEARAKWVPLNQDHFTQRATKGLPILNLNVGETEELLGFKAKKRPVVVVGTAATLWGGLEQEGTRRHQEEDRIVLVPIYDLASEDDPRGFGSVLATRVRHLLYRQYFPIAAWQETRNVRGGSSFREGIARFDRLQFLLPNPARIRFGPSEACSRCTDVDARDALGIPTRGAHR